MISPNITNVQPCTKFKSVPINAIRHTTTSEFFIPVPQKGINENLKHSVKYIKNIKKCPLLLQLEVSGEFHIGEFLRI
jgi:hypothetical protein